MLVPPPLAALHDAFVRRYTRTRKAVFMKTTRPVFVMTKTGFIRPALLRIREVVTASSLAKGETRYIGTLLAVSSKAHHLLVRVYYRWHR